MSIENLKKINFSSDDIRKFASERFGTLRKLADAMGISPPNLAQYLSGKREFGASFRERLAETGFFDWSSKSQSLISDEYNPKPINIDIQGAMDLSNTPAARLAQLMSISVETLNAWMEGKKSPNIEELTRLFNLIVALALARKEPVKVPVERQAAG